MNFSRGFWPQGTSRGPFGCSLGRKPRVFATIYTFLGGFGPRGALGALKPRVFATMCIFLGVLAPGDLQGSFWVPKVPPKRLFPQEMGSNASPVQLLATSFLVSGARALFLEEMGSNASSMQLGLFSIAPLSFGRFLRAGFQCRGAGEGSEFWRGWGSPFSSLAPSPPSSAVDPPSGPDPLCVNTVFLYVFDPELHIRFSRFSDP